MWTGGSRTRRHLEPLLRKMNLWCESSADDETIEEDPSEIINEVASKKLQDKMRKIIYRGNNKKGKCGQERKGEGSGGEIDDLVTPTSGDRPGSTNIDSLALD